MDKLTKVLKEAKSLNSFNLKGIATIHEEFVKIQCNYILPEVKAQLSTELYQRELKNEMSKLIRTLDCKINKKGTRKSDLIEDIERLKLVLL